MKEQSEPITPDEWLLRRVHKKDFVSLALPAVDKYAFKPNVDGYYPDESGISLYRQSCLNNLDEVFSKTPDEKCRNYGIVRISVAFLIDHNLTVLRDDDEVEPIIFGHVVIPELNSHAYVDNKNVILPLMTLLADHVNARTAILRLPHDIDP